MPTAEREYLCPVQMQLFASQRRALKELAQETGRSVSDHIREAIREHLERAKASGA